MNMKNLGKNKHNEQNKNLIKNNDPSRRRIVLSALQQRQLVTNLLVAKTIAYHCVSLLFLISIITTKIICVDCEDVQNQAFVSDQASRLAQNIIAARGYIAQEHVVSTTPSHKLLLIRLINPLIRKPPRGPVLLAHGILESAATWVENSDNVQPENLSWLDLENLSEASLLKSLAGKPVSHSLAFLMSDLGFDVWLYNSRETTESLLLNQIDLQTLQPSPAGERARQVAAPEQLGQLQRDHKGADLISAITGIISPVLVPVITQARASLNTLFEASMTKGVNYWDFSLDDEATIDLPTIIDYVLSQNLRFEKIKYVCHSAGCAIFLMCLSSRPEYGHKIENAALFAPALNVGNLRYNPVFDVATALEPLLVNSDIPIPGPFLIQLIFDSITALCKTRGLSMEHCTRLQGNLEGENFGQNKPLVTLLQPIGGREVAQLIQSLNKGRMHHFDFGNPFANKHAYGQIVPPIYDVTRIQTRKLSIWQGNTDALVMVYDTKKIAEQLPDSLIVEYRYINNTGIAFNHHSFFVHNNVNTLVNIPAVKSLVT